MIVTLTANPSLDRTVELDGALEPGAVQRAVSTRQDPGGKGVNVTRALRASGVESVAVLPAAVGDPILAALDAEGVPYRAVPIDGAVRTNLTIVDAAGVTTKVNEPGPALDAAAQSRLIDVAAEAALGADWLVLAGSLPPGVGDDFYVRVVAAVRAAAEHAGSTAPQIAADTSGAALAALVDCGVGIDLIKPNAEELAELTGSSDEAALEAGPDEAIASRALAPRRAGAREPRHARRRRRRARHRGSCLARAGPPRRAAKHRRSGRLLARGLPRRRRRGCVASRRARPRRGIRCRRRSPPGQRGAHPRPGRPGPGHRHRGRRSSGRRPPVRRTPCPTSSNRAWSCSMPISAPTSPA